jgi:hypothetical protein
MYPLFCYCLIIVYDTCEALKFCLWVHVHSCEVFTGRPCNQNFGTKSREFLSVKWLPMSWKTAAQLSGKQPRPSRFSDPINVQTNEFVRLRPHVWTWSLGRRASSELLRCVTLVRIDFSEERIASIFRVTRIGELGTTLALDTANFFLAR